MELPYMLGMKTAPSSSPMSAMPVGTRTSSKVGVQLYLLPLGRSPIGRVSCYLSKPGGTMPSGLLKLEAVCSVHLSAGYSAGAIQLRIAIHF